MPFWELQDPSSGRRVLLNSDNLAAILELPAADKSSPTMAGAVSISGAAFPLPFSFDAVREMFNEEIDVAADDDEGEAEH